MTPRNITENNKIYYYLKALNYAFGKDNDDIFNIGITGDYGSGKSSIWKTFVEMNENKYKIVNVTLADFKKEDKEKDKDKKNLVNILQNKIVNQLIYQLDKASLKKSNILLKYMKKNSWSKFFWILCFSILLLTSFKCENS